eukprot:g3508.t1
MFASNVVKFNVSNEEVLRALREDDVKKSKKLASNIITDKSPKEDEGVEHLGVLEAKTRIFGPWTEFSVIIGKDEIKFYRRPNVKVDPEDVGSSVDAKENEKSFGVASKFLDIKLPFKSIKCVWDWSFRLFYRNNQDAAIRGTGTFPARFPKHPLMKHKGEVRERSSIEVFDQEEEVMRLRIEDKTSDSSSSSDLSSASSFVASSTTPPPPPDDFCANKKKDSTFPCDHQRDSVFTQESKEWWTKIERERRESTARTKHMTLLRRAMLIGIRVFKYGRDGKACARYMWTDENFERICVTVARPTSVSRASRSKGVDVSNVIDICRGTGTEIFRRAFRKTEPSKTVQKRCFSFVLREPQKSVFKTMLAKSSLRASLDVEISDDVAEAALISRWLVAALSSQIGLPFDKDELGEEMYRAMDAHFTKHWGD